MIALHINVFPTDQSEASVYAARQAAIGISMGLRAVAARLINSDFSTITGYFVETDDGLMLLSGVLGVALEPGRLYEVRGGLNPATMSRVTVWGETKTTLSEGSVEGATEMAKMAGSNQILTGSRLLTLLEFSHPKAADLFKLTDVVVGETKRKLYSLQTPQVGK